MMIITLALVVSAATCLVLANSYFFEILGEVNAKSEMKMSRLGINLRLFDILDRHRELYPASNKRSRANQWTFAGFGLLAMAVVVNVVYAARFQ